MKENFFGNWPLFVGFAWLVFSALCRTPTLLFLTKHTVLPFSAEAKENLDIIFNSKTYDLYNYYRMIKVVNLILSLVACILDLLIGFIFPLVFSITFFQDQHTPGWYFDPSMARDANTFGWLFAYVGIVFIYWVADSVIDIIYQAASLTGGWAYYVKYAKEIGAEGLLTDVISSHKKEKKQKEFGLSGTYKPLDNV